jgi:hypothetical protein
MNLMDVVGEEPEMRMVRPMKVVHGEVRVKIPSLQGAARSSSALEAQASGWRRSRRMSARSVDDQTDGGR